MKIPEIDEQLIKTTIVSGGVLITQPIALLQVPVTFPPDQTHQWEVISNEQGQLYWRAVYDSHGVPLDRQGQPVCKDYSEFLDTYMPQTERVPEIEIGEGGSESEVHQDGGHGETEDDGEDVSGAERDD